MDDDLTALVVADAREHMAKAVDHTQAEFGAVRTGRATPALVEHLKIEYYGTETELRQMAGFSVPEARLLVVSPYDKGALPAIEKALQSSDLGITPSNDGSVIRLSFPVPTEQRRKELVKVVK
jgi:ribosome recycling factor